MKKFILFIYFFSFLTLAESQSLMTVREVYDYNIGDIFIRRGSNTGNPPLYMKQIITNKYYSSLLDTVFYNYDYYSFHWPAIYDTLYNLPLYYTHLDDTVGAGLGAKIHYWTPDCIDTAGYTGVWLDTNYLDASFCNILSTKISRIDNGPQLDDTCYTYFEGLWGYDEYGKGVGLKHHYYNTCAMGGGSCEEELILLYYQKGTDTCGTIPDEMTTVNEPVQGNSFEIFPNPVQGNFTIQLNSQVTDVRVEIYNAFGEKVYFSEAVNMEQTINNEFASGIYFIKISDGERQVTEKIIVQ